MILVAAVAFPAAAGAQSRAPRDTIRLGAAARDTVHLSADAPDTSAEPPARSSRWGEPFAVEASGRVAERPGGGDVVWLAADSVRALRVAARRAARDAAAADDSASSDSTASDSTADAPPARPATRTRRAASADTAAAPRRGSARTAARDTSASGRRAAASSRAAAARTGARAPARDAAATGRSTRTASRDTAARARPATRPRTHTVAPGESLSAIARRYGVTTAELRALNPDAADGIDPGMVLRLPASAKAPARTAAAARETASSDDSGDSARSDDSADRSTADDAGTRPRRARPDDDQADSTPRSSSGEGDAKPRRGATARTTTARTAAPGAKSTGGSRTGAGAARAAASGRRTHVVAAHETLFGIARRYGVTVAALKAANHLSGDAVRTGQTLTIPAAPKD